MTAFRAALVGTGAIAREHLRALAELADVRVVAVCDRSPALAAMTAERFGVPAWYADLDRMLEEVRPDVVHVTTPPASHFAIARAALERGAHVLCEKPITVDRAELEELRRLAVERRRLLVENQNLRCHSSVLRIQALVDAGELGEVVGVELEVVLDIGGPGSRFADRNLPHPALSLPGGAIGDFLPHLAYLTRLLAGEPRAVRTSWRKRTQGVLPADEFRALVECDRASAWLSFSASGQPPAFRVRVLGSRAQVEADLYEPPRLVLRRGSAGQNPLGPLLRGLSESRQLFAGSVRALGRKIAGTSSYDGLPLFLSRTYDAVAGRCDPPVAPGEIDAVARLAAALARPESLA